ncbi:hypothetical protein MKEN_00930700 [Mycena kentingensis (nom. inval.)]|nr:hypothetical protein MKEN_00930700 [Mycena kentingensis (nom. inval.)]
MDLGLTDVHVLITGSSGGIGLETTRLFLQQGAKVTAHYHSVSGLAKLQPLILEFGPSRIFPFQAQLTSESDTAALFSTASASLGPAQIAVINHAVSPPENVPVAEMSLERWRATLDTNLTGAFLVARELLKSLKAVEDAKVKEKASIVFVGSTAGKYGEADHADYAASKSALMYGLTLSLKNEIVKIAPKGRVNCVAPGWVKTPKKEGVMADKDFVYRCVATSPLKKVAEPSDISNQILVLSSPVLSGHITGQVVVVAGGMEGRLLNRMTENGIEAY